MKKNIQFANNPLVAEDPDRYIAVQVHAAKIVKSWRDSLFSFEWLYPDGHIKAPEDLSTPEQEKRLAVEKLLSSNAVIPMPVLGIGMMDNVEIGSGRAEFLTLAAHGIDIISVHIPKSCESDFKPFRADVK